MNKAVFLDRDGTLIEDVGYLSNEKDISLIEGAAEAVHDLKNAGFKTVMITNQAAISRGIITEDRFKEINAQILSEFSKKGADFDGVYYCPHHPTEGKGKYLVNCSCRKPLPGMLLKAAQELDLDLAGSFMIGDKDIDIEAGAKAGCKTALVLTGYGNSSKNSPRAKPDHISANILDASQWVLRKGGFRQ